MKRINGTQKIGGGAGSVIFFGGERVTYRCWIDKCDKVCVRVRDCVGGREGDD